MMKVKKLACDKIEATAATQIRVKLDRGVIDTYAEDIKAGAIMPPIDVFREKNSQRYILADGFHRHRAAINAGQDKISCNVFDGDMVDALIHALGCNSQHGLRRSNADKRHAVEMALKDPEISQLRTQEIADMCRVTKRTVNKILNEQLSGNSSQDENVSQQNKKGVKPKKPKAKDFRDNGAKPTQADVDLGELRQAIGLFKALPYAGEEIDRLEVTPADIMDLEYVSTWCAEAVVKMRTKG